MARTVLATAASSWAVLMGLAPLLQIRRMLREHSSQEVSLGYFLNPAHRVHAVDRLRGSSRDCGACDSQYSCPARGIGRRDRRAAPPPAARPKMIARSAMPQNSRSCRMRVAQPVRRRWGPIVGGGDGGLRSGGPSPSVALELMLQPRPDPALHANAERPEQRAKQPQPALRPHLSICGGSRAIPVTTTTMARVSAST